MDIWSIDKQTGIAWVDYRDKVRERFPEANYCFKVISPMKLKFLITIDGEGNSMPLGVDRACSFRAWKSAYLFIKKREDESGEDRTESSSV